MTKHEDALESFVPLGAKEEPVHELSRAEARSGFEVFRASDGFEAAIPAAVIDRALAWGRAAAPNEWYGLVVGKLCREIDRVHVVVLGIVPDIEAITGLNHVRTTEASELCTRRHAKILFPDGIIVGWAHGHVRHGVRFSSTDRATQRTWTRPHSLGVVFDPWSAERLRVHRGPNSERLPLVIAERVNEENTKTRFPRPGLRSRLSEFAAWSREHAFRILIVCATAVLAWWSFHISSRLAEIEASAARERVPIAETLPVSAGAQAAPVMQSRGADAETCAPEPALVPSSP